MSKGNLSVRGTIYQAVTRLAFIKNVEIGAQAAELILAALPEAYESLSDQQKVAYNTLKNAGR